MVTFDKCFTIGLYVFIALGNGFSSQELYSGAPCDLLDGSPGFCKSAPTCEWLKKQLSTSRITLRDLPKLRCGFESNQEITCCGDPLPNQSRKAEKACELYRKERQPTLTYQIYNGNLTALGEFPHMAALGYLSEENNQQIIDFKCGGSLISERFILTAAHCGARITPIVARLGSLNIKNSGDPETVGIILDVNIESVILHPEYVSFRNYDDIALVRLTKNVPFTENLHPACLNTDLSDTLPTTELIITGWGNIDATDARSDFLLKTNLTVVKLTECNRTLTQFFGRKLPNGLNSGHFCAYDPNGLSDACQGDSGGPIQIIDDSDGRAMPIIIGVTSFGIACGTKLPSIYARVAFYLDWIEPYVWPN